MSWQLGAAIWLLSAFVPMLSWVLWEVEVAGRIHDRPRSLDFESAGVSDLREYKGPVGRVLMKGNLHAFVACALYASAITFLAVIRRAPWLTAGVGLLVMNVMMAGGVGIWAVRWYIPAVIKLTRYKKKAKEEAHRQYQQLTERVELLLNSKIDVPQFSNIDQQADVVDLRTEEGKALEREARSALGVDDERLARRLAELAQWTVAHKSDEYKASREAKYDEMKSIGRDLYSNGGHKRMLKVGYRVKALDSLAGAYVDSYWTGIGEWQG